MAIVDLFSRKVLTWRVSIILKVDFCVVALEEALVHFGKLEILNTDQGNQLTSMAFINAPTARSTKSGPGSAGV